MHYDLFLVLSTDISFSSLKPALSALNSHRPVVHRTIILSLSDGEDDA